MRDIFDLTGTRARGPLTAAGLIAVLQEMIAAEPALADALVYVRSDELGGVNLEHSTPHPDSQEPDHVPSVDIW